jgi:SAM-dependent methyltransferase
MPQNPHYYTLRKNWGDAPGFEDVVQYIRDHGYKIRFGRTDYTCLDINGQRYWTMGAPLAKTTLINRAFNEKPAVYDAIAERYDDLFSSPEDRAESQRVVESVGYTGGSVLDIGCGTGLFLDHEKPSFYLGIDPSHGMVARLQAKHLGAGTTITPLESFWPGCQFDLIISLFGSPSYVSGPALQRIPDMVAPGGRYFLMFYAPDYTPVTYDRSGVHAVPHLHLHDILPGTVTRTGKYFVIEGKRHEVFSEQERPRRRAGADTVAVRKRRRRLFGRQG